MSLEYHETQKNQIVVLKTKNKALKNKSSQSSIVSECNCDKYKYIFQEFLTKEQIKAK